MSGGSTWLVDAIAATDGTIDGVGKYLAERVPLLPPEDLPPALRGKSPEELEAFLVKLVGDAYETSVTVTEYMDGEREKGRGFEDIYTEVQPYLNSWTPDADDGEADLFEPTVRRSDASRRRQRSRPEDPRLSAPAADTASRSGARTSGSRRMPRPSEIREPLILVGTVNEWSPEEARREHAFKFTGPRDISFQESALRLLVPPEGAAFQVLSAKRGAQWRLRPEGARCTLKKGVTRSVDVCLRYDKAAEPTAVVASRQAFRIEGTGRPMAVDVRAALGLETGLQVWFEDASCLPDLGD